MQLVEKTQSLFSGVVKGKVKKPFLLIVYGPDGVGKSSFAAAAPKPIFIDVEGGSENLDVSRWQPKTLEEIYAQLDTLLNEPHEYQTAVLDSLDWTEPLVWGHVCRKNNWDSIEAPGYGKGYVAALEEWANLRDKLKALREKGMNLILTCHSTLKTFQDPTNNAGYDRYQLKLNDKAGSLFREFVEGVLFANYEVFAKPDKDGKKAKAYGDGARLLFTERRPSFDAKNRLGLPFQLPLSFEEFELAVALKSGEKPEAIIESIRGLMKSLSAETRANVEKRLEEFKGDKEKLLILKNRVIAATENV